MINVQIVLVIVEYIVEIIFCVCLVDIEEFVVMNGWSVVCVLECGFCILIFCCVGLINGCVVIVFGVVFVLMIGGSGIFWFVGMDDLECYQ